MQIPTTPLKTIKCDRCNENLSFWEIPYKRKECASSKCSVKKLKFLKKCAFIFECNIDDFFRPLRGKVEIHKEPDPPVYTGYQWPHHHRSGMTPTWVCHNTPNKDCPGTDSPACCSFEAYGYID